MELFEVLVLGVVQGLTEFLPVSSSGHLVLVRALFDIPDVAGTAMDAWLHLGTLLAVLIYYWRIWRHLDWALAKLLLIGTVPAALVGYFLAAHVADTFRSPSAVAVGLLITAAVLLVVELWPRKTVLARVTEKDSLLIGLAQVVALIPGVSRSGMTMVAGYRLGLSRERAAEFSFLLSAPIIAGAGLSQLGGLVVSEAYSVSLLLVGFLAAFGSGWLAIRWLLSIVQKHSFWPFVIYLVVVAGIIFITSPGS